MKVIDNVGLNRFIVSQEQSSLEECIKFLGAKNPSIILSNTIDGLPNIAFNVVFTNIIILSSSGWTVDMAKGMFSLFNYQFEMNVFNSLKFSFFKRLKAGKYNLIEIDIDASCVAKIESLETKLQLFDKMNPNKDLRLGLSH